MDALYRLGKASAAEIRDAVDDAPTYTAVRTHLTNMEAKGFVKFQSDGTRYIYEPAVPRDEMAEVVMSNVMETFFENRLELIVSSLISRKEANVSKEELDRIAQIIEAARSEGR